MRFWFWVDLMASFPFDIIFMDSSDSNSGNTEVGENLRLNKLFRMLRVFKVSCRCGRSRRRRRFRLRHLDLLTRC